MSPMHEYIEKRLLEIDQVELALEVLDRDNTYTLDDYFSYLYKERANTFNPETILWNAYRKLCSTHNLSSDFLTNEAYSFYQKVDFNCGYFTGNAASIAYFIKDMNFDLSPLDSLSRNNFENVKESILRYVFLHQIKDRTPTDQEIETLNNLYWLSAFANTNKDSEQLKDMDWMDDIYLKYLSEHGYGSIVKFGQSFIQNHLKSSKFIPYIDKCLDEFNNIKSEFNLSSNQMFGILSYGSDLNDACYSRSVLSKVIVELMRSEKDFFLNTFLGSIPDRQLDSSIGPLALTYVYLYTEYNQCPDMLSREGVLRIFPELENRDALDILEETYSDIKTQARLSSIYSIEDLFRAITHPYQLECEYSSDLPFIDI